MIFPLWAIFGLGSASLSACMLLLQERIKVDGFVAAFWGKVACALVMIPFVAVTGFPKDPLFYVYLALSAGLYSISDVIFYNGVTKTNAGAVARMLPSSAILSFIIWFVIDPSLLGKYMNAPVIFALIFATLCLFGFFASRLRKCPVSMETFRAVWFVIFAAMAGSILSKLIMLHAPAGQGPAAYTFCQALMMLSFWLVYLIVRRPADAASRLLNRQGLTGGLSIGCFNAGMTFLAAAAYYYVDNPAYIPAVRFLDCIIILFVYKALGRKTEGDIASGLGVAACAAILVILKAQIR